MLIENDMCPLSIDELNNWKNYKKGVGRVYPVDNIPFQKWISLDFDNDGVSDYTSPYQLRRELITKKYDLENKIERQKLGRALYHIAQRRGFKSSRKQGANEKTAVYKGSNETKTIGRNEYEDLIIKHGSLGAAFAHLEDEGIRVRNRYTLRADYKDEVDKILNFQEISDNYLRDKMLLETSNGSIFYQRPLRSQKGLIGKCTLEPSKARCPISHPKFEEYRAWSFINNIRYRTSENSEFESIPIELKEKLYKDKFFFISKRDFEFSEIRKYIKANGGADWELNYSSKMDKISVPSCFVTARLKSVFGEDWRNYKKTILRKDKKGYEQSITYTIEDIWHILFSFEDDEYFRQFLENIIELNENQIKELNTLYNNFPVGYANLSLKAINNILPFLREGMIYSDAVILAKIPEIIGKDLFNTNKNIILNAVKDEIEKNRFQKRIVAIVNNLIFKYYALDFQDKFGWKDISYKLDDIDLKDIEIATIENFGEKTWVKLDNDYKISILSKVKEAYQDFFSSSKREHIKPPHLVNQIKQFISAKFGTNEKVLDKIYHPSQIAIYPKKEGQQYLLSPKTAAFKNPMAYKSLYKLREVINHLIEIGKIDEETRIVVEVARDLNDSNKRWAINSHQRDREAENRQFAEIISELAKDPEFSGSADANSETDINKFRLWYEQIEDYETLMEGLKEIDNNKALSISEKEIKKYRLWKEQNCACIYTGKIISLTDLFNQNIIDFEHTIPRSKSFDNSLANLTVCYADYNRNIKGNKLPTELPNYENESNGYTAIKPRLKAWERRADNLFNQIDFWKTKSKTAMDKNEKDYAIRQGHLRKMEYDYWKNKLDRFTRTEVPQGFVNSQLIDTQIITKYAFHYLKTVFNKVDVIKGSNTAQFRKIYGIQAKDEIKDRSMHYHHAIDAAVLTLIPSARKREEILKKSYEYEELHRGKQYTEVPFKGFNYSMIEEIKRNILVNNIADKDQTLTPTVKRVRKRGRITWLKDENDRFLLDNKGNKIPKIAQGDSIRGELHQQTYYGKIKIAAKDEKGRLVKDEEGNILYNQVDGNDEIWMVIRRPISDIKFPSTGLIVDTDLEEHLNRQIKNGIKPYELKDFQNNTIRRVRCRVKSGRGYMNPDNVTKVKEQTYRSEKEYKNYIWADSGDNYLFALYENEKGREIVAVNKFEAANVLSTVKEVQTKADLFKHKEPVYIKNSEAILIHIFEVGQKAIFIDDNEDIHDIISDNELLSKRLYFIKRFHQASAGNMVFQHHLEARSDERLMIDFPKEKHKMAGRDGFSKYQTEFVAPRLLFKPTSKNILFETLDFEMTIKGSIKIINNI
ncbi:MAG: hypothetical protein GX140_09640 [Bacteroidales bacterium]|nr:hypothetical protein [Bacteroidales bacterium]